MNIDQKGIDLIKSFEGLQLKAYNATGKEKYNTIGYGHYGADVRAGQVITIQQAEDMLKNDLQKFVDGVNNLLKTTVNQYQFDALVSFAYNCGLGNLGSSDLLKFVNKRDFTSAALEFAKWNKAGGVVLAGLTRRREAERQLFVTAPPKPAYTGVSLVDYLASINKPTDFVSRQKLAKANGMNYYSGSSEDNTKLLNILRSK
jgi:GH24 family phage-related lysozyme (muramidase)